MILISEFIAILLNALFTRIAINDYEEIRINLEKELAEAEARAIGEARGRKIGEERLSILINHLIMDGRSTEIQSVVTNAETRKRLYKEYRM